MTQIKSLRTGIKFKDTPIGKIPVDWDVRKLGDVSHVRRGASPRPINDTKWFGGSVGWVRIADLTSSKKYLRKTKDYLSEEGVKNSVRIKRGEVILSICATIGRPIIVDMDACIHDGFVWFEGLKEDIEREFFYYFFENKEKEFASRRQTGTQGNLNTSIISNAYIPLPPFPEQKKIAEILTTVDDAIEETDRIIEKTKELKKGLMQKLFTRGVGHKKFKKTEIGEIPVMWEVVRLKELANVRYGLGQPPALDDNGIPMVRATNIHEGAISKTGLISVKRDALPPSRNPFLKDGDIIVVRSGAYTGDIGLITKEWEGAVTGYDLVVTPSSRINSIFLTNYLLSNIIQKGYFASLKERSAQPHLNSLQVEETPIVLPPLTEQIKIAEVLSSTHLEIKQEEAHKRNLEALKKSLMQVLLTGRVRVKLH